MKEAIKAAFNNAQIVLDDFVEDQQNLNNVLQMSEIIADTFKKGNKVLICGNGGSAADAIHFAEELTGRFRKNRRALPAIALTDPAHITCVANDFGFEYIFSKGVEAYGNEDDVFIGISTSGNSANVIKAVEMAKNKKMTTFALLGKDGGKLKSQCEHEMIIKGETTDRIQEIHMMILHIAIEGIERIMFPQNYSE